MSNIKPHITFRKGYWRARLGAWEFAGTTPVMAYNNFAHWNKFQLEVKRNERTS